MNIIALQKLLNLTLKKSIEQTLSWCMYDFLARPGRCRGGVQREGRCRGWYRGAVHVGNVNRCSLAAHYVCENFDSRNCCCAIVRDPFPLSPSLSLSLSASAISLSLSVCDSAQRSQHIQVKGHSAEFALQKKVSTSTSGM